MPGYNNSPNFEAIKHVSNTDMEYWYARELSTLLGYVQWRRFEDAIKKATLACQHAGINPDNHFAGVGKMINIGKGAKRQVKDFILTRFACYLIAQNGDPRKLEIASAQAYFAATTREQELFKLFQQQQERLLLREQMEENNQLLKQAAAKAGVSAKHFKNFENAGYEGLYGGLNIEQIKTKKEIEPEEDILDRMGRAELAANSFRATQTEMKIRKDQIEGQTVATETHRDIGGRIRSLIEEIGGTLPEDIPAEPSLKPLLSKKSRPKKKALLSDS
jgi:DNA-damage-inducible protein D